MKTTEINIFTECKYCGGKMSGIRTDGEKYWQHCYACHMEFPFIFPKLKDS